MLRSLYGRLALSLLGLLILLAAMYAVVGVYVAEMYGQEVRQKLNRELAAHLVDEGLLLRDREVDPEALEHILHMLMVINPNIEVYVLDPDGAILAYSTPPGALRRHRVSLDPVRTFVEGKAPFPIAGDDPRSDAGRKVFSAAVLGPADRPEGYVYVVLGGQKYDSAVQRVLGSYVLRMGVAGAIAALLFAAVSGVVLFGRITRRLRRLSAAMESFDDHGVVTEPLPPGRSDGDEIDRLAATFSKMAARIQSQLDRLEHADRTRRELVANVSHDLRTPLASLSGYLETLLLKADRLDAAERRRYLEIAVTHCNRLGARIGKLFELSKLDSPDVRLERETFSVAELAQDVVQKFALEADRKRIRLRTERDRDVSLVEADIGLIERVIENLLGNAIQHTPEEGDVTVSVAANGAQVRVQVRDSGPGIADEELELVFERLHRGREDGGGTGLGLAIAKRIVELHGGAIDVTSHVGEGSVFGFSIPVRPP